MSHFCVLVIGESVDEQLEPYYEGLELPMHQVATKEDLVSKCRDWISRYNKGWYSEYLKDPEKYKESYAGYENHLKYISEEFPKMLEWTDEQCYEHEISDYRSYIEDGETWCEIHEDGSLWKTSNENAKWDWFQIGGRFRGRLKLKKPQPKAPLYSGWQYGDDKDYQNLVKDGFCDQAYCKDIANLNSLTSFAVVKDGEWYERGQMGWWCYVANEKDESVWDSELKELLANLPGDTLLTVVDCHI